MTFPFPLYISTQPSVPPLTGVLDGVANVYMAHGTALLLSAYTGPLFQLTRALDYGSKDVYPATGSIWPDMGAISTWLSGTTGYITCRYDQTGNSRNYTAPYVSAPTINLAGTCPVAQSTSASIQTTVGNTATKAFSQNVAGLSLLFVRKYITTTGSQMPVYASVGTSTNVRCGLYLTGGAINAIGRRLDADSSGSTTGIVPDTSWHVETGRFDYANAALHHSIDGTSETNSSFLTTGSTSNTASQSSLIGSSSGTSFFNGYDTAVAWVQRSLTDPENASLITAMAALGGSI